MNAADKARLKQLHEEQLRANEDRKVILEEARTENAEGVAPGLTGELLARYTASDSVIDSTQDEMDAIQRTAAAERKAAEFIEEGADDAGTSEERYAAAFDSFVRNGEARMDEADRMVLRDQGTVTDAQGGYTVAEGFWNRISEIQREFGGMESVSNVITTSTGANLPWMTADTTAQKGEIVGERGAIAEEGVTFGQRNLGAYKYTSKHVKASWEILQDSEVDMASYLGRKLAERLSRVHNEHQTIGTGTGQPLGLMTGLAAEVTAAAVLPEHDELIDLVYSLDPAYEANASFMLNNKSLGMIRKIEDGDGNKVWQPSLVAGQPGSILGYSFTRNQDMPDPIAGASPVIFGDFREAYVIRKVKGMELIRLDELFALNGQVGFVAWDRMDSTQDNVDAVKVLALP